MGDIVGGVLGGVGSIIGSVIQSNAADAAAKQALTGYNYLTTGAGKQPSQNIIDAGQAGLQTSQQSQDAQKQLLGLAPPTAATGNAFKNYLGSTGYDFQMKQGQDAIATSAASKGLLNSGGTAKALEEYGQGLGSNYFNNYLSQLGGLNTEGANSSTSGQNQLTTIANAGTGAGSNAAQYTAAGGNAIANGVTGALGGFGGALTNVLSRGATA